jgi:hypothetical protein
VLSFTLTMLLVRNKPAESAEQVVESEA